MRSAARQRYYATFAGAIQAGGLFVQQARHGLALTAIRDSEAAAESLGVNNLRTKVSVYLITAFGTGMVGALIFLQKLRISPDAAFSVTDWMASVLFIVIIATCCIAGCLMAIPYIGAVLLLPVFVFRRAYSLYYMQQYGPEFDVIESEDAPPPSPGGLQSVPPAG